MIHSCVSSVVPAPLCAGVVPSDGGLMVTFLFWHTGGRNLTSISVFYVRMGLTAAPLEQAVGVADRMATITNLVVDYTYSVSVRAANEIGSTTVPCSLATTSTGTHN